LLRSIGTIVALFIIILSSSSSSSSQGFPVSFISRRRFNARSTRHLSTLQPCASLFAVAAIFSRCYLLYFKYSSLIFCEEEIVVCSVASIAWCVFLSVFMQRMRKK
jgi:hypothetical protein